MLKNKILILKKRSYDILTLFFVHIKSHLYLGWLARQFETIEFMVKHSKWVAQNKVQNSILNGFIRGDEKQLHETTFKDENLESPIDYLEFGVATGTTLGWWTTMNRHPDTRFYGFDTFTGLPEKWQAFTEGTFSNSGHFPDINDNRVTFIKGLFQETFHVFLRNRSFNRRMVVHLDADLFSSTLCVLTQLYPHIKKNDILIFDELNDVRHEFKALTLFSEAFYVKYQVLSGMNGFCNVAVKIL